MAQTQIYAGKTQVHVTEETVAQDQYKAPNNDGSDIIRAQNVAVTYNSTNYEQNIVRADYLMMDDVPGMISAQLTFEVPLSGSGDAGDVEPEWTNAMKACGMEVSASVGVSHAFTPTSTFDSAGGNPHDSYSVSFLRNGVRHAVKGCFGNVVLTANVGEPGLLAFTFTGAYVAFADDATETPTYQTTIPPAFMGATFAAFGVTPKGVRTLTYDFGANVVLGQDVNESTGHYGSRIVGRRGFGSFDPEETLQATHDHFGGWVAGTTGSVTTGAIGSTNNAWTLTVARAIRRSVGHADRDGILADTVGFSTVSAATDVEGTNADVTLLIT